MLKHIELSGFKSFAVRSKIEFNSPISAIVGPNGSGKSNIAEAFRFVLGEQSKKNLRSSSAEDLIWAGGPGKPKMARARVSLLFDNRNRIFKNLDFDEILFERILHADGVSEYLLNGSSVRLKDALYTLASAGLGPSSHHIISQGEADRILRAGEEERLDILKDALGLNKYFLKKKEAERKLSATLSNMRELKIRLAEMAPRIEYLKSQMEKKKKIDALQEELFAKYLLYVTASKKELARKKSELSQELDALKLRLANTSKAISELSEVAESDSSSSWSLFMQQARSDFAALDEKIQKKQKLKSELEAELSLLNFGPARLNSSDSGYLHAPKSFFESGADKLRLAKHHLKEGATGPAKEVVSELEEDFRKILSKSEKQNEGADKQARIKEIKEELRRLDAELFDLKLERESLLEKINSAQEKASSEMRKVKERQSKIVALSEQRAGLNEKIKQKEREKLEIQAVEFNLNEYIQDATERFGERFLREFRNAQERDAGTGQNAESDERLVKLSREIERIKGKIENLGSFDEAIVKEYELAKEREGFFKKELDDLEKSRRSSKLIIEELERQLELELAKGVSKVGEEFDKFFKILFGGGEASLERLKEKDEEKDEERDLLKLSVQIPGKKISSLESLSGGERSLVSIALIFAFSQVTPPPFILLDETDAALDEMNSKKYSELLLELSRSSDIITITHNRQTMSVAGALYGITMSPSAYSQVLSIDLQKAYSVAK